MDYDDKTAESALARNLYYMGLIGPAPV